MATMGGNSVFLDTNILVYATLERSPLCSVVEARLQSLDEAGVELWLSRQVLREYLSAMTRASAVAGPAPIEDVLDDVRQYEAHFLIAEDSAAVTAQLLDLMSTIPLGGKQVHDANIVATMLAHGISRLLTHNTADFQRFAAHIAIEPLVP